MVIQTSLLSAGSSGYQIARSLRFNDDDTAYLSDTSVAPTLGTVGTFSAWIKRGNLGINTGIFSGSPNDRIFFNTSDQLCFFNAASGYITTTQVFRDPNAWGHLVAAFDTRTGARRCTLYWNNVQVGQTTTITADVLLDFNESAVARYIGRDIYGSTYFDGYMAEVYWIDGQELTPSSFGETDSTTGVWNPKKYGGTYGLNGFYLDFSDNSNTTSATLGKDRSGNSNDWTPTNFSVTTGEGNDSLTDTPTNYDDGTLHGNFPTLSSIHRTVGGNVFMANGNLDFQTTGAAYFGFAAATMEIPRSGKWYWEVKVGSAGDSVSYNYLRSIAVVTEAGMNYGLMAQVGAGGYDQYTYRYLHTGRKAAKASVGSDGAGDAYGTKVLPDDVVGVAVDMTNTSDIKIYYHKNGTWQNSSDPTTGTNPAFSGITERLWPCSFTFYTNTTTWDRFNFGQRAFAYTPPTGYKAICSQNLATPTIVKGSNYFFSSKYTGSASTQSIAVPFQPDFVFVKSRSTAHGARIIDSTRGSTTVLPGEASTAESTVSGYSITSSGFDVPANIAGVSATGVVYHAMALKKLSGFFDIVTWTGDNTTNRNISHSLGVAPKYAICRGRNTSSIATGSTQFIHHVDHPAANSFQIYNYTGGTAPSATNTPFGTGNWSASQFMVSHNATYSLNATGINYVAYLFADDNGVCSTGKYIGNATTNGPVVNEPNNADFVFLTPNSTNVGVALDLYSSNVTVQGGNQAEGFAAFAAQDDPVFSTAYWDSLSNGFKLRSTYAFVNGSVDYYYCALGRTSFKYGRAV